MEGERALWGRRGKGGQSATIGHDKGSHHWECDSLLFTLIQFDDLRLLCRGELVLDSLELRLAT